MGSSFKQKKQRDGRPRQQTLAAWALVLGLLTPVVSRAQACVTGSLESYSAVGSCSIGGVTLQTSNIVLSFNGSQQALDRINVTPLDGLNANGRYFGFRLTSADANPIFSTKISASDARVLNPNYDPSNPALTPAYLPYVAKRSFTTRLGWGLTHSLTSPNAITRLELQTLGRASSTSQVPIAPTLLTPGVFDGSPDNDTGCGNGASTQMCGFFEAFNDNYLWRGVSGENTIARTILQSSGEFSTPDAVTSLCIENGVFGAGQATCTSYQDIRGIDFGTGVLLNVNQVASAMFTFGPDAQRGLIDPDAPNYADYGASASLDQAEFRVYYRTGNTVVPEPSTWALMAMGLGGVLLASRRRRRGV